VNKGIILGVVSLFVFMSFTSISGNQIKENTVIPSYTGNSLYGGGGEFRSMSFDKINDEISLSDDIKIPDCVEKGDILLIDLPYDESNIWKKPGPYNEHSAIYIGNNTFIHAENTKHGVTYENSTLILEAKNLAFLRVKSANSSNKQAAVNFSKEQVGSEYQKPFAFPWKSLKIANPNFPHPTASKLYCMELVWAAYYNQGIDIDQNGWDGPCCVTGEDIITDGDIEIIYSDVNDSTDIVRPNKGIYIANKKIISTDSKNIIFGDIEIEAVTCNDMITRVDFFIDNIYKGNATTPPYKWNWDERVSGKKVIKAVACDDFGNQYSTNITVIKFF
jgi:uncharacterized protein YycO